MTADPVLVIHDEDNDDLMAEVVNDVLFLDCFNYREGNGAEHVNLNLCRDDALALAEFIRKQFPDIE